ncbi:precorrin-3B synthase [Ancylobacter moscoviensis]
MSDVARLRRGACPSLPRPMRTGDGLLARLQPRAPLTLDQFDGLARLARELGNGILEVTARGKLQLRGLSEASAGPLAEGVGALGIEMPEGFPVEVNALAGRDPAEVFDPRPLAQAIAQAAAGLVPRLAPKVSVVVDGGGTLRLGELKADIGVSAGEAGTRLIALAGQPVGLAAPEQAVAVVVALLERLAAQGSAARMPELLAQEGAEALAASLGLAPAGVISRPAPSEPVGLHALKDGTFALGVGLAFGQVAAATLEDFARAAGAVGVRRVEPAAGRALLATGLTRAAAERLRAQAGALGFITDPADPRRRVFACAGQPACASARLETHALASTLAPLMRGGELHVSGCVKGCAHPAPAALTIVGLDEGAGLVVEGTPRDVPARIVPVAGVPGAVREFLKKDPI